MVVSHKRMLMCWYLSMEPGKVEYAEPWERVWSVGSFASVPQLPCFQY